ncbi:MAG: hypothetical protein NZZ41_03270 [Candidatus Dojkabacteria bacterium]|nr:hypothetical protein [Candidatus Dojkabacteria bacterium]
MITLEKFLFELNPEKSAINFIEHYNLRTLSFNSLRQIQILLYKLNIDLKILPIKNYYSTSKNYTIILNSNTPIDTWALSILLELSKIIIPKELQSKDYIYTFSNSILIPPSFRIVLWKKLYTFISNRNYKLFFYNIKKIDNFVSPESVFFTLTKYYEKDFGKFYQFKLFCQKIRNT